MAGWNWENLPRCTPAPALSNLCSGKHVSEEIYSAKSIWSGSCLFVNVLAVPHHPCSRRPLRCMCTQGGASGTRDEGAWAPRSRFRQKLHPSSQAWPLLSASNRGETAIAKCPNYFGLSAFARGPRSPALEEGMRAEVGASSVYLPPCALNRLYFCPRHWTF